MAKKAYIGVDGVARKIRKGYIGVDGVARKIKKAYIGDENGLARLCYLGKPNSLEECSWAEISEIAASGQAKNCFAVGDCKEITINGTVGTISVNGKYCVYIIGFDHNGATNTIDFGTFKTALSDGVDVCLTDTTSNFFSEDGTKYFNMNHGGNTNAYGWKGCDLRYDILGSTNVNDGDATATTATSPVYGTLMSALPSDLRAVMKPMTIYTHNGADTTTNITASVDYLPLMAEFEVIGVRSEAHTSEQNYQKQYAYYAAGNSAVKYHHTATSTAAEWWLRSPMNGATAYFITISKWGGRNYLAARYSRGVSPIFRV